VGFGLGEFEQVVLLAILRLGDNAYGVTIRAEIAARRSGADGGAGVRGGEIGAEGFAPGDAGLKAGMAG
jgi:hypothetical protein